MLRNIMFQQIKNHNPRKGTETKIRMVEIKFFNLWKIKNHNPRKGTETKGGQS